MACFDEVDNLGGVLYKFTAGRRQHRDYRRSDIRQDNLLVDGAGRGPLLEGLTLEAQVGARLAGVVRQLSAIEHIAVRFGAFRLAPLKALVQPGLQVSKHLGPLRLIENLVIQLRIDLERLVLGADRLEQESGARRRSQAISLAVHQQQRQANISGLFLDPLHGGKQLRYLARGQLATVDQRVIQVLLYFQRVAADAAGVQLQYTHARRHHREKLDQQALPDRWLQVGLDGGPGQHAPHEIVLVLQQVATGDQAAHAMP